MGAYKGKFVEIENEEGRDGEFFTTYKIKENKNFYWQDGMFEGKFKTKRYLMFEIDEEKCGKVGKKTNLYDKNGKRLRVGDIVKRNGYECFVCNDKVDGDYIMGYCDATRTFRMRMYLEEFKRTKSYKNVKDGTRIKSVRVVREYKRIE